MKCLILFILLNSTLFIFAQEKIELDSISKILEDVYKTDQDPRLALDSIGVRFGYGSAEMMKHWKKMNETDSLNAITISHIIDTYGWLSASQTSEKANSTLFLVIQHSNIKLREKYLPVLKTAVEQGKAQAKDYAYMLDRSLMDRGKFQIYG